MGWSRLSSASISTVAPQPAYGPSPLPLTSLREGGGEGGGGSSAAADAPPRLLASPSPPPEPSSSPDLTPTKGQLGAAPCATSSRRANATSPESTTRGQKVASPLRSYQSS